MGDVFQFIEDSTSGLVADGVDGKAMVAGVCSKGQVGKGYAVNASSDLAGMLGVGPLVDRLRDILVTGGQKLVVVAVPVSGQAASYITAPVGKGTGVVQVVPRVVGLAQRNADVVVEVVSAGQVGVATVKVSTDGGANFEAAQAITASFPVTGTGATLVFDDTAILQAGVQYSFVTRVAVGPVTLYGEGPAISIDGTVLAGAEIVVQIVKQGGLNEGVFQISVDGGDNYSLTRTIPADGVYELADYGVTLTFPEGQYKGGATYTCRLLPPKPAIVDVMEALETPLSIYDVELVHVVGESDSVDWAAGAAKTEELWNLQRPTRFKFETRLPRDGEDLNDFAAWLLAERQGFAARYVSVCCQFGEVSESTGLRKLRTWAGLHTGRSLSVPVQREAGRVRDGNIVQGTLPDGWEAVRGSLYDAGYITAKKYAGLNGAYWDRSKTMAEATSDYRFEVVLRVVFKGVRLERIEALKSLNDEAGDPLNMEENGGLAFLQANLENALDVMVGAIPKELAGYVVDIPAGQDIANNGIVVATTFIGIPIIGKITIYNRYVYAGGKFDPRMAEAA